MNGTSPLKVGREAGGFIGACFAGKAGPSTGLETGSNEITARLLVLTKVAVEKSAVGHMVR